MSVCVHGRPEPASCLHVMAHFHHQRAPSPAQSGTQRCEAACLLGVPEPGSPSALADELLHAAHVQGVGRRLGGSKPASDSLRKACSPHPCPGRVASRGGADTAPPSLVLLTPSSQPGWCPRKWRGEGSRRPPPSRTCLSAYRTRGALLGTLEVCPSAPQEPLMQVGTLCL